MIAMGMTFAWLAVQVTLVLAPAIVAYVLAARRGPAAGASAAALGLGMVVVLSVAAFLPGWPGEGRNEPVRDVVQKAADPVAETPLQRRDVEARSGFQPWRLDGWRIAWDRIGRGAAEPASRCRPWASWIGGIFLAGAVVGSLWMAVGMVAIVACRRRGRIVDDPDLLAMLDELRGAIGCRRSVEVREVDDLEGPAAAGWRRPMILLPDDWRSWDENDRRAVLAHELAHIVRGDYTAGLVARVAVAMNGFHPLVWWLAARLRWQQELAADAIGARLAGGRAGYLVALSRMALKQDGRSRCWPARAFLPSRGTLIRRIAMLNDGLIDRPWTRGRRLATTAMLVGLTAAVMTLRGPARGGEPAAPARAPAAKSGPPIYFTSRMNGVLALHTEAMSRNEGAARLWPLLSGIDIGIDFAWLAKKLAVDRNRPGFIRPRLSDIEWITLGIHFGEARANNGRVMHRLETDHWTIRMVAPFDWLAYLRQWRFDLTEIREGNGRYYRIVGMMAEQFWPGGGIYLPDDRTVVFGDEKELRSLARGEVPPLPTYLRSADWERACRGLLAIAFDNHDGSLAKDYDLGRPDDAAVLRMLKGVDHWTFCLEDNETISLRAEAHCEGADPAEAVAQHAGMLAQLGREALGALKLAPGDQHERAVSMGRDLLSKLGIVREGNVVRAHTTGFGTIADLASVVEKEMERDRAITAQAKPAVKR